ncbi:MAG: ATP-dependent DNA ligase [Nanoarchaeota archaeon]|nr:ATP-dependent DNA ligase [Nanoarchaeota archaeon]
MKYNKLVEIYSELESTSKRLEKTDILAKFLKKVDDSDMANVMNLISGRVFPLWDSRNIGFSSRLLIKAISSSTGADVGRIEKEFNRLGDLGDVASLLLKTKTQQTLFSEKLTVKKVVENLKKLSELEGNGSVDRKIGLVAELLSNASAEEARYISRTVLEILRVGIADGIIKDSIAKAFGNDVTEIDEAFDLVSDHGEVAMLAKNNNLKSLKLRPGRPMKLMLAILAKNVQDGFSVVGSPAALEHKYDGFRLQVHNDGKTVKLFTRNMENVTTQFPDIVRNLKSSVNAKNYIIDCEAVGYSPNSGKYLPFQKISQRIKRKYDTDYVAREFPVELNIFDIIYYNGKSLLNNVFSYRRELLEKIIRQTKKKVVLSRLLITDDHNKAERFFKDSIKEGHEGLIFKSLNSVYRPGRYVGYMAKLKDVMDSLDLVIVKSEWGNGKRASWLTSYTVACRNGDDFLEVGKVSTGLKEKSEGDDKNNFYDMTKELKKIIISEKGKEVIVKPKIVVEVSYEEIQKSPTYSSKYALRFPRIITIREDKPLTEIATLDDVKKLYINQNK